MLFAVTVVLSAFLLFQVQLVVAKQLLPWFGGTPTVWTICQMFFQLIVLGGYLYGHALTTRAKLRKQYRIHLGVLAAAGAGLVAVAVWSGVPLLAAESMKASRGVHPAVQLFVLLVITAGLPAFAVSTTGPLLQNWHARAMNPLTRTYRLYALSNAGSLLGLLSYPVAVERLLTLRQQAWVWTALFAVFAAGAGVIARRTVVQSRPIEDRDDEAAAPDARQPSPATAAMWLLLSLAGSLIVLATTNHLSQDVAAVPFLWVLPLAIYLITFIVCFDHPGRYSRRWMLAAGLPLTIVVGAGVLSEASLPSQLIVYASFVFCLCTLCHGELVLLRPGAAHLTKFYVLVALGGALGGVFVGIIAPVVLPDVWEFHLATVLAWAALMIAWSRDRSSPFFVGDRLAFALCVAAVLFLAVRYVIERTDLERIAWIQANSWAITAGLVIVPVMGTSLLGWRFRVARAACWPRAAVGLAIGLAALFFVGRVLKDRDGALHSVRNFYGVVRVVFDERSGVEVKQLVHGAILHGMQVDTLAGRNTPTAYYSRSSGIALASTDLIRQPEFLAGSGGSLHVGVIGMGIGTMSAFGRAIDRVRYYEINPEVVALALGPKAYFTFVNDSSAKATVILGDARVSLERELAAGQRQRFDLLSMDAFSGDSVPVHLLTREAFDVYTAHLRNEQSILAVNVSNRYLDLEPVVSANARRLGFSGVRVDTAGDPPFLVPSSWILLSRRSLTFRNAPANFNARPLTTSSVPFTDQYSNLFRVLRADVASPATEE